MKTKNDKVNKGSTGKITCFIKMYTNNPKFSKIVQFCIACLLFQYAEPYKSLLFDLLSIKVQKDKMTQSYVNL